MIGKIIDTKPVFSTEDRVNIAQQIIDDPAIAAHATLCKICHAIHTKTLPALKDDVFNRINADHCTQRSTLLSVVNFEDAESFIHLLKTARVRFVDLIFGEGAKPLTHCAVFISKLEFKRLLCLWVNHYSQFVDIQINDADISSN